MYQLFYLLFFFQVLSQCSSASASKVTKRPHIVIIVADDLGWNDVGFHGSNQIPTPNLDALAYGGIILHNYYVNPICTPSRAALMTGLHPIHTGMQSGVLVGAAPYALPLENRLMPEFLNNLGYQSQFVGKWHLGSHRAVYTPTKRGFLSHIGYWTGHMDYYDHTAEERYSIVDGWGYDFRRNMSVAWEDFGIYSTDLFTNESVKIIENHAATKNGSEPLFLYLAHQAVHSANSYAPLQAPQETVDSFNYIKDPNRRKFAAMLAKLDESVGKVVTALQENNMLQDSIIVFTSDNGGPAEGFNLNYASNWPLRGVKDTLWEGGVRGAGFIWSPLLKSAPRVSNQMMNVQDWLPTLYYAAGGKMSDLPQMDGLQMWQSLSENKDSPRTLMLHNIDDEREIAAVRVGDWKLMKGTTYEGKWDDWFGPTGREGRYDLSLVLESPAGQSLRKIGMGINPEVACHNRATAEVKCPKNRPGNGKPCQLTQQVCLFNVTADPCELNNVVFDYPDVVRIMEGTIEMFRSTAIPPGNKPIDPRGDPKLYGYTWTNWLDYCEPEDIEDRTPKLLPTNFNDVSVISALSDRNDILNFNN